MLTTTYPLAEAGTGTVVLMLLLGLALGGAATWAYTWWQANRETGRQRAAAAKLKADAEQQAADILKAAEVTAQKKHIEALQRFETETAETRAELKAAERRLAKREDALDKKLEVLTTKERKIELAEQRLAEREREIEQKNAAADEALIQQRNELLRIARLTPEQAKQLCLQRIESEVEREAGELVDRIISHAEENAREKARYITITAIQRYAAEHTCETTVATVDVPSDDMKGRIIGREGRNIRAFEKSTGATVIVDDTPGIVSVSCMDPVRKEVARLSLDRLIRDGRIHPTRIEEIVAEVTKEVDQRIIEAGKAAAAEVNVQGIHKKIIETLGRLQYRTSYGQNVLRHSIEVAFLCGMMADELGLEGPLARRCALLHDIGKALDHEHEGAHTRTGYEFARRFNEPPAVLNAIIGHHGDVAATHPYTPLVAAADAISAARPGGRRESLERYIKRLQDLENIATSFSGVDLAYAIEAGREVRVIVDASTVDDSAALKLARDVANKIEQDMVTFPGEIKVTVLRELRATEYAISGRHRSNGSANVS
ncbi:MAG TPA: ribonuclease Y [Phycisphaerae bacterium]|jgi:ribonuclease Y|nr:ribonuclease Y [Phycisphaerae bacterium]HPC23549.1 ribonuclease Y [Phycisphaerae bacterium]HRS29396.1 ribonuclease Y [Phycisphaerae bacterium]HRT42785.1 ribonuclease Y [Phycisphaerae bacterium]